MTQRKDNIEGQITRIRGILLLILPSIFCYSIGHKKKHRKISIQILIVYLFLGVYGDVHRVKILFNKKDSALIQFAVPQQAAVGKWNYGINNHSIQCI